MEHLKINAKNSLRQPERRVALKAGLAIAPIAISGTAHAQWRSGGTSISPSTTPFLEPMPIMPQLQQRPLTDSAFSHPPTARPNRALNPATGIPFEGRGEEHQLRGMNPPQQFYVQRFGAVPAMSIHPNLQLQVNFWGANLGGADLRVDKPITPLPTIVSRYQWGANTALLVRRFNSLPTGASSGGFGKKPNIFAYPQFSLCTRQRRRTL